MLMYSLIVAVGATAHHLPTYYTVPTADYTTYRVHARWDDGLVCCGELWTTPYSAQTWSFDALPPFDFYGELDWTIQQDTGHGLAIWAFPPGGSWYPFNNIVGEFHGSGPLHLEHPWDGWQAAFFWDGQIPNLPLETAYFETCRTDFNGDGYVEIQDLLFLLANWGLPYDVNDFLDLIENFCVNAFCGCDGGPE